MSLQHFNIVARGEAVAHSWGAAALEQIGESAQVYRAASLLPILAARTREERDNGKFIFGVIFAIIWAAVAVIGKLNKKSQQQGPTAQIPPLPPPSHTHAPPPSIPQNGADPDGPGPARCRPRPRTAPAVAGAGATAAATAPAAAIAATSIPAAAARPAPTSSPRRCSNAVHRRHACSPRPCRSEGPPPQPAATTATLPGDADNDNVPHLPHESGGSLKSTATAFPESLQDQVSATEIGGGRTPSKNAAQAAKKLPAAGAPLIALAQPHHASLAVHPNRILQPPLGMREPRL